MRSLAIALLLALPLLSLAVVGQEGDGRAPLLAINVVEAVDVDCSDDVIAGDADLRVTVLVNGQVALRTVKAQDQDEPYYAAYAQVTDVAVPAEVVVEVEEAEPAGLFGTDWVACDVTPGGARAHTTTWDGQETTIEAEGDGDRRARATVVLGPSAPDLPVAQVDQVSTDTARALWDAPPQGQAQHHRLRLSTVGPIVAERGGGADTFELAGLCDNWDYELTVVRVQRPWHLPSEPAPFRTHNAAPEAPEVLEATREENDTVRLRWATRTVHDVERFEIYVGDASLAPDRSAPHATLSGQPVVSQHLQHELLNVPAGATDVLVRTVDTGGLWTDSAAFTIDGQSLSYEPQTPVCTVGVAAEPASEPTEPQDQQPQSTPDQPRGPTPAPGVEPPRDPVPAGSPPEGAVTVDLWTAMLGGAVLVLAFIGVVSLVRK